jgi:hypothetical protein
MTEISHEFLACLGLDERATETDVARSFAALLGFGIPRDEELWCLYAQTLDSRREHAGMLDDGAYATLALIAAERRGATIERWSHELGMADVYLAEDALGWAVMSRLVPALTARGLLELGG